MRVVLACIQQLQQSNFQMSASTYSDSFIFTYCRPYQASTQQALLYHFKCIRYILCYKVRVQGRSTQMTHLYMGIFTSDQSSYTSFSKGHAYLIVKLQICVKQILLSSLQISILHQIIPIKELYLRTLQHSAMVYFQWLTH